MGQEINGNAALTLSDTTGIGEVMDDIRSLLDNAGLTYHETANPESCEKPHMIVPMLDAQTNKVTAVCCLLISARTENGDADSINIAKILNRQRDSLMAAGLHENVRIVEIACLPNLSADRHALHLLNQVPDYTLYREDFEQFQNDPSLFSAKLEKCVAKDAEKLAERSPFLKMPEGMDEDDLNTILDDYYQSEISLAGKGGEQNVNDMLDRLPGAACYMSPYCIDDSNVCDHVLLDKNGFVIIETKNWHNIQSVSKSHVELAGGVVRPNPDKQLQRYKERLTAELLRKYPYYSADYIRQHIRSVLWLPQVERNPEAADAFDSPVIFQGEGENPIILQEKLDSLFPETEPLSGAAYQDFRRMLEPSYTPCLPVEGDYSELRVWDADEFTPEDARRSVMSWMRGTKQVHFFRSQKDLEVLRHQLFKDMAERNICVDPENSFELRFGDGSDYAPTNSIGIENYMQLFKFEAYVLPKGDYHKMHIINGKMTDSEKAELLTIQNQQIELLNDGIDGGVFSFEQYAAEHGQSGYHTAVRAGAGTGKTYLLTAKVSYLLYCCSRAGITSLPEQIVMLTFTNEAAGNMRKRIKGMLFSFFVLTGNPIFTRCIEELSGMQICTIDAFCERLIQENPIPLGVGSDCTVTTSTYQYRQILDEAIARHFPEDLDHAYYDADLREAVYTIGETILLKGTRISECTFPFSENTDNPVEQWLRESLPTILLEAQTKYETYLRERNQILLPNFAHDALACITSEHFNTRRYDIRYVFVDEFQDTSDTQIAVLQALQSKLSFQIFIVGDSKQSIYGFRDASASAFEKIMTNAAEWKTFQLTINRRSTNALIACTNQTCEDIYQATGRRLPIFKKSAAALKSIRNTESVIQTIPLTNTKTTDAAAEFTGKIKDLHDAHPELLQNAVILARTNTQVQMLTAAANRAGLHVEAVNDQGSGDYYGQPPVLDLYFLLSALTHPRQAPYLFALLLTNFFRVGQLKADADIKMDSAAMNAIASQTDNLMSYLDNILTQQDTPEQALRDFLQDGHISYHSLRSMCEKYLTDLDVKRYAPFYPNALGEDSYAALVEIINGCLAKYASDEPYLHDWESLCRETSNTGNATSLLKILYELFTLTQPWKNYSRQDEKERYIANFKKLFEEVAESFCHQQMTLDGLYEALKLQILTHQQKESAAIERQSDAIKSMTIHKSKGLEFGTVFLFSGNATDWAGNDTLCTVRHMENGMSEVGFRMQLQPIGSTETQTIATQQFTSSADADEEWRVLYVALTRAKNNLIVSYIDRNDGKRNPWNTVLRRIKSNLNP